MTYITHTELAERPGATELAQVATPGHQAVVAAELLDAALRGNDRSAWSTADNDAADATLRVIDDAVADAAALIDGYLVQRGYTLPIAIGHAGRSVLTAWCRAIARYLLQKDAISDEKASSVARDYRDALMTLKLLAEGKFSLGGDDPKADAGQGSATDVRFSYDPPVFGRSQLRSFR